MDKPVAASDLVFFLFLRCDLVLVLLETCHCRLAGSFSLGLGKKIRDNSCFRALLYAMRYVRAQERIYTASVESLFTDASHAHMYRRLFVRMTKVRQASFFRFTRRYL